MADNSKAQWVALETHACCTSKLKKKIINVGYVLSYALGFFHKRLLFIPTTKQIQDTS